MLGVLLECCESAEIDAESGRLRLSLKPGVQRDLLLGGENRERLCQYAKECMGLTPEFVQSNFKEMGKLSSGMDEKKELPPCKIKEELVNSPLVQEAIRLFHARIVDVKNLNKEKDA
jgi:hypothetical protein